MKVFGFVAIVAISFLLLQGMNILFRGSMPWQVMMLIGAGFGLYAVLKDDGSYERKQEVIKSMTPAERQQFQLEESNSLEFGSINHVLICPHCQSSGTVRSKQTIQVTKNRVNSVLGQAVGLGTNSSKEVNQMHCDRCQTTWLV
jgi:hypothetical protein